ncbi:MAG TPA: hypothetical protein VJZ69_05710 [Clostridia bacterium]|nr:hypothetical protein [Clostridia bacterium]
MRKRSQDYVEASISMEDRIEQRKKLNNKLIPFNIFIAVISLVAIISLLLGNFWSVSIEYNVDNATIEQLVASGGGLPEEVAVDYNALDINVAFVVSLNLQPKDLIKGVFGDNSDAVSAMIGSVLKDVLNTAKDLVKQVFSAGVKIALVTAFNEIKNNEEIATLIGDMDLQPVEDIVVELFEETPDTEQIGQDLLAFISAQVAASGETLTPEMENEIMASYNQTITSLSDEGGNFSLGTAVEVMLTEAGVETGEGTGSVVTEEQILASVEAQVMNKMDENTQKYIAIAYKILGGILVFTMALWASLLIMTILRTLVAKRKGVKFWYIILFGALPFLLFYAIPTLGIKYGMPLAEQYLGESAGMLSNLAISFSSISFISAICTLVLMLMSIFVYGKLKRNAKHA